MTSQARGGYAHAPPKLHAEDDGDLIDPDDGEFLSVPFFFH